MSNIHYFDFKGRSVTVSSADSVDELVDDYLDNLGEYEELDFESDRPYTVDMGYLEDDEIE